VRVWTGAENLSPTGIRSPDRPARNETLYRLNYPGPHKREYRCVFPTEQVFQFVCETDFKCLRFRILKVVTINSMPVVTPCRSVEITEVSREFTAPVFRYVLSSSRSSRFVHIVGKFLPNYTAEHSQVKYN
jgi:hypothetical protein